jgi:ribosomal protein S27AE
MPKTDWAAISDALWVRSNGACERCGSFLLDADHAHRHHRKLRSQGGGHHVANLVLLCTLCHGAVHAHPTKAKHAGFIVAGWAQPEKVPVFHSLLGLVWLADDGSYSEQPPESAP